MRVRIKNLIAIIFLILMTFLYSRTVIAETLHYDAFSRGLSGSHTDNIEEKRSTFTAVKNLLKRGVAIKQEVRHYLSGDLEGGGHSIHGRYLKIIKVNSRPLVNGVYEATFENTINNRTAKKTFFPDRWSPEKISRMISMAVEKHMNSHKKSLIVEEWVRDKGEGIEDMVKIRVIFQPYGKSYRIASAYPLYEAMR